MGGAATVFSVEELMKLHRGFVTRGEVKRLGRIEKIVFGEVPAGVPLKIPAAELVQEGRCFDWMGQGPMLGLSPGDVDLLVVTDLPPLPDKPDLSWQRPYVTQQEIERVKRETGSWRPAQAPLKKQIPEDRGASRLKNSQILSFEPVHEVLFRPIGLLTYGTVLAYTDDASRTKMAFLWDFSTGHGFFYGGRFLVKI